MTRTEEVAVPHRTFTMVLDHPGGHGPMEDLAHDPVSGAVLTPTAPHRSPATG